MKDNSRREELCRQAFQSSKIKQFMELIKEIDRLLREANILRFGSCEVYVLSLHHAAVLVSCAEHQSCSRQPQPRRASHQRIHLKFTRYGIGVLDLYSSTRSCSILIDAFSLKRPILQAEETGHKLWGGSTLREKFGYTPQNKICASRVLFS